MNNTTTGAEQSNTKNQKWERQAGKATRDEQKAKRKYDALVELMSKTCNNMKNVKDVEALLMFILPFLKNVLNENMFRYLIGGISIVCINVTVKKMARYAGCNVKLVIRGRKDYRNGNIPDFMHIRKEGAGRKRILNATIEAAIIQYVKLRSYGPCTKDTKEYCAATLRSIVEFINEKFGQKVSRNTVAAFLLSQHIRMRTNKKFLYANQGTETDQQRVMRHSQFENIFYVQKLIEDETCILLSGDGKKNENMGPFKASKGSLTLKEKEVEVKDHDYVITLKVDTLKDMDDLLDRQEGKAIPQGIYDMKTKKAYFNIGISSDTPEFNVRTLDRFMPEILKDHPKADKLYILCDGGGSNSSHSLVFKYYLFMISLKYKIKIYVCHYPPYRSKFNPIERMVFAFVSKQFERSPIYNLRTLIALIEGTRTKSVSEWRVELDIHVYEKGVQLTDEQKKILEKVKYIQSPNGVDTKLFYCIDGSKLSKKECLFLNEWNKLPKTIFEVKDEIDLSLREKAAMKAEKERKKAAKKDKKNGKDASGSSPGKKSRKPAKGKTTPM